MTRPRPRHTAACVLSLLIVAVACGGRSSTVGGDDDGSGGTAQAGNGNGPGAGGSTRGGTGPSTGGKSPSTGGSGVAGGNASGTGGGAPIDEACSAPPVTGTCEAYIESWYHDAATGICRPFVYGGCDGNKNRYASRYDCLQACARQNPSYAACTVPTDCAIGGVSCCGVCDGPDVGQRDLIAYNRKFADQVAISCAVPLGAPAPPSDQAPIACAPCPMSPDGALKYFVPGCVFGRCNVIDLREDAVTACSSEGDCRVRRGNQCCEGCGGSGDLIAVRVDGSFEKLVCGGGAISCPACDPGPINAKAFCEAGHCKVGPETLR